MLSMTSKVHWILALLLMMAKMNAGIVPVEDFFEMDSWDATSVTWAHAVNTKAALEEALDGDVMMIEADVMMGRKDGSTKLVPVMAHPPNIITDLSLDDFMEMVVQSQREGNNKRKGIKLDFKQIEAAEIGLKALERLDKKEELHFPVWVNADILQGPVNSTKSPLDAKTFLDLVHKHLPASTISIGWVTRYGRDDIKEDPNNLELRTIRDGEYTTDHIEEMLSLIDKMPAEWETHITFPVRAGLAARSEGRILHLINAIFDHEASITLWSPEDDPVDLIKLKQLISMLGNARTFIDLPFDLRNGPIVIPDPILERSGSTSRFLTHSTNICILALILAFVVNLYSRKV